MSDVIFDASALLAVLFREDGADRVAPHVHTAFISAVNLSEVVAKAVERGGSLEDASRSLARFEFEAVPFDREQAFLAASLRPLTRALGLSFADRACLALGLRTGRRVLTAERKWSGLDLGVAVEVIR